MKYSQEKAKEVLWFFHKAISPCAELIGAHSKGKESNHDIDIHLPVIKRRDRMVRHIARMLDAKKYERTDWGGVYYFDTHFGDIDVFFQGSTKDFTY